MVPLNEITATSIVEDLNLEIDIPEHVLDEERTVASLIAFVTRRILECEAHPIIRRELYRSINTQLSSDQRLSPSLIGEVIETMIATGEIVEIRNQQQYLDGLALQYSGYVAISPSKKLLLGSESFWLSEAEKDKFNIKRNESSRYTDASDLYSALELESDIWLSAPKSVTASFLVEKYVSELQAQPTVRFTPEVEIVSRDTNLRRRYYKARKRKPKKSDSGFFIADGGLGHWVFVEIQFGEATRLINFNNDEYQSMLAEARHLMYALDSVENYTNEYVSRGAQTSQGFIRQVGIFSPPVPWVDRYLTSINIPAEDVGNIVGSLKTYNLSSENLEKCKELLQDYMYMREGTL